MKKILTLSVMLILALSLAACSSADPKQTAKPVVLEDVYAEMTKDVTLPEMVELSDTMATFGIAEADYSEYVGFTSNEPTKADVIIIFMAVNSDAATRIETALNNYRDAKLEEANGYNADMYSVLTASSVQRSAYYVCFVASGQRDALMTVYNKYIR